ncbi:MAG: hypothetical protein ACRENU_04460 [Gemmatimonadaceae bacterium]
MPGRLGFAACIALVLSGCDIPETPLAPQPRQLLVHAALDAGSSRQVITIEWSDESPMNPGPTAAITVTGPFGEVYGAAVEASPNNRQVYVITQMLVLPSEEYTLRVELGPTAVTGTTTIPHATPARCCAVSALAFSRSRDTLRLSWPRVPGAKAYHVSIQNEFVEAGEPVTYGTYYSTFADTSIALAGTLKTLDQGAAFTAGAIVTVLVSAVDDNFYTYYHAQVDPFAGAPASRLTGGLGVFGSLVPIVYRRLGVQP